MFARVEGPSSPGKFRPAYSFISTFASMLVLGFLFLVSGCGAAFPFDSGSPVVFRWKLKSRAESPSTLFKFSLFLLTEFDKSKGC